MNILVVKDYSEMSRRAASLIAAHIALKPDVVLGLPTGKTPLGMYGELVRLYKSGLIDFRKVTIFYLDEYVGVSRDDPLSFYSYMQKYLLKRVNIEYKNVYIPDGMATDLETECRSYEGLIRRCGQIDLMVLGIGHNGHIGFNEPSDEFIAETHIETLTYETRRANARYFGSLKSVPVKAITMGVGTIMLSNKIILLACGKDKADTIYRAVKGNITPRLPASILRMHRDCTFILDKEAAGKIRGIP